MDMKNLFVPTHRAQEVDIAKCMFAVISTLFLVWALKVYENQ
jgi:hypothetical protein